MMVEERGGMMREACNQKMIGSVGSQSDRDRKVSVVSIDEIRLTLILLTNFHSNEAAAWPHIIFRLVSLQTSQTCARYPI